MRRRVILYAVPLKLAKPTLQRTIMRLPCNGGKPAQPTASFSLRLKGELQPLYPTGLPPSPARCCGNHRSFHCPVMTPYLQALCGLLSLSHCL